jgi:hypothetical protein
MVPIGWGPAPANARILAVRRTSDGDRLHGRVGAWRAVAPWARDRDRLEVVCDKRGRSRKRACDGVTGARPRFGADVPAPPGGKETRNLCLDTDEEANHARLQGVR